MKKLKRRTRSGQLAFFGHFFELGANPGNGAGCSIRPGIKQFDRMTGGGSHLGNAGTHGAGADNGDDCRLG